MLKLSFLANIPELEPIEDLEMMCGVELPQLVKKAAARAGKVRERVLKIMQSGNGLGGRQLSQAAPPVNGWRRCGKRKNLQLEDLQSMIT
jgi:hypothetical protein